VQEVARGYATLEYEADSGQRGKRQDHVRALARDLFGVPDALAVNNNAGALFLALTALCRGRRVLVSRGELVAIGGSFKIPEILEASGALLAEVGTTNRTTIEDYRRALGPDAAMILTVHPSNYEVRGYTARPAPAEVAALAREAGIPWLHDQGTGCVEPLEEFGVAGEPTVAACLADGPDLVTFSADKLLCGPQAGLVVGRADLISALTAHPVARAVRLDKLALAALAATLAGWKRGGWRDFPVYRAAGRSLEELQGRGAALAAAAAGNRGLAVAIEPSEALFGGGTSPEKCFASRALALSHERLDAEELAVRLRRRRPPIVGRVEEGRLWLDLRAVEPEEDAEIAAGLSELR
jgi:L-seryl-tRNA(Ser) seleniumtransferase